MARPTFFTRFFGVRLAEDTAAWLEAKSREQRLHQSAIIRRCIEAEATRDLLPVSEDVDDG